MKKIYSLICSSLLLLGGTAACDDGSLDHDDVYIPDPVEETDEDDGYSSEPSTESVIRIQAGEGHEHQTIDGFGCAFCGWSAATYTSMQREQIMEDLFGEDGLNFNIFRGEVYPSYMYPDGNYDFGMERNYKYAANDPYLVDDLWGDFNGESSGLQMQLAQMWLVDYLCKKQRDDIYYFFSVWSPPGLWKNDAEPDNPIIGGEFNSAYNATYAKYLVDFMDAYKQKFGIDIYGISGWNEPDQAMGGWAGCVWTYQQMADFVHNHLRPELDNRGYQDTKVIYGELPWWNNGVTYFNNSLRTEPNLSGDNIVAAAHAYSSDPKTMNAVTKAEENNIPVWLTETCDDKTRTETWQDAMKWAKYYQGYLKDVRMNALVWWAGARHCTSTGENLLQLDDLTPSQTYYRVDRYYSIGQFSKWIRRGMRRVDVETVSTKANKIPKELTATAYVNDDTYTIVLVNSSEKTAFDALIEFEGKDFQNMISYTSSASVKWLRKKQNPSMSGKRAVTVPKYSVVTITGKFKEKGAQAE